MAIRSIGKRVLATLERGPHEIEAWESVPLDLYGAALASEIRSSWVFVLRRGVTTGAERHTVAAEDLIEERPDPADPDPFHPRHTRRRRYAEVLQP